MGCLPHERGLPDRMALGGRDPHSGQERALRKYLVHWSSVYRILVDRTASGSSPPT